MVEEITLDIASSMKQIAKTCFLLANQVTDRFHVQKLAVETIQDVRVEYRWEAMEEENETILKAKKKKEKYTEN